MNEGQETGSTLLRHGLTLVDEDARQGKVLLLGGSWMVGVVIRPRSMAEGLSQTCLSDMRPGRLPGSYSQSGTQGRSFAD